MINNRPVLIFDTSVHNRLMKDGLESEAIFAALQCGYVVRLAGLSVEELISTLDPDIRRKLMATAGRLQFGLTDCLMPQNEMLSLLISAYEAGPQSFQWKSVDVRSPEHAREISRRDIWTDDQVAVEQQQHLKAYKKQFCDVWNQLRVKLEEIYQRDDEPRPLQLSEIIPHALEEGGVFWGIAKGLFDHVASAPGSDEAVRHFVDVCPPFRCVVYSCVMAWYDRSLRALPNGEKFHAGRIDLFMSCYLPYCDRFISAEVKDEQRKCLAEIAVLAKLPTVVQSYDDFCASLLLPVFS